jgi:hypothetical protein
MAKVYPDEHVDRLVANRPHRVGVQRERVVVRSVRIGLTHRRGR